MSKRFFILEKQTVVLTLKEAQARLPDLIHNMSPGDEVSITEQNRTVAKLIISAVEAPRPLAGRGRGTLIVLAEDDEHLEDFQEYLP